MSCARPYPLSRIQESRGIPRCSCGGIIKPDVVLYEEGLDGYVLEQAVSDISSADMLIIGGTSLAVYPAAGLVRYYRGNRLVLLNKSETPFDSKANLVIHRAIGTVLEQISVR
jgi:NAD-dependent deacetylase